MPPTDRGGWPWGLNRHTVKTEIQRIWQKILYLNRTPAIPAIVGFFAPKICRSTAVIRVADFSHDIAVLIKIQWKWLELRIEMHLFWPHNRPFGSASKNGVTPQNTNNRITINLFCFKTLRLKTKKSDNWNIFFLYSI